MICGIKLLTEVNVTCFKLPAFILFSSDFIQ